jgi:O-antigen/teichoic acid export membrane protein
MLNLYPPQMPLFVRAAASRWSSVGVVGRGRDKARKVIHRARHAAGQPLGQAKQERAHDFQKIIPDLTGAEDGMRERQLAGPSVFPSPARPNMATPEVSATSLAPTIQSRVVSLFKDPALRGALALMFSSVAAGGLGFVFWAFTAHHLDASAVGSVSAEVSSITFLATVGGLNLITIFARFLPVAGWHSRRLILTSYGAVALAGLLAATVFLLTPMATGLVLGGGLGRFAFAVCVVLTSVFSIQDGGLIGFGRFGWVPVENISVALARLALLPVVAMFLSARIGVLWSWAVPMTISVLVVNVLIVGRLAGQQAKQRPSLPSFGDLGRFVAIDSVTTAVFAAVGIFLPALVTLRLGSTQGGYFYVPWVITMMVCLLLTNISIPMVREAVANPEKADFTIRRSIGLALLVIIIAMTACLLLARLVLAPLGSNFAVHGAPLLHWVGLSIPATAVIVLFWAACLVRRRPWPVFAVNVTTSGAIIGGVLLLRLGTDISRVGMIYCIVQWAAAAAVSLPTFTALRIIRMARNHERAVGPYQSTCGLRGNRLLRRGG